MGVRIAEHPYLVASVAGLLLVGGLSSRAGASGGVTLFLDGFEFLPPHVEIAGSPPAVFVGGTTTIEWGVFGAELCRPSGGGTSGWGNLAIDLPNGLFVTPPLHEETTFRLTCVNAAGESEALVVIPATVPGFPGPDFVPPGCSANPIPGTARQKFPSTYAEPFGDWPGNIGDWVDIGIQTDQWLALWFETGPELTSGKMLTIPSAQVGGDRPKTISISRCPGDFQQHTTECGFDQAYTTASLWWWTFGATDGPVCPLLPNSHYYLNVIFADKAAPELTLCRDSQGKPMSLCTFQGIPGWPWH